MAAVDDWMRFFNHGVVISTFGMRSPSLCDSWFGEGIPPKGKYVDVTETAGIWLPPGASAQVTLDLNSENFPPDRGHIELTIANEGEPA